jgi:hypothetical protein
MARNRYYNGPLSDHFDGTRFSNPGQPSTDRSLRAILRWKLAGGAAKWPTSVPVTPARPEARVDGLCVTMVGHASLLIQAAGVNILTDPVWPERASPFRRVGPRRVTALTLRPAALRAFFRKSCTQSTQPRLTVSSGR